MSEREANARLLRERVEAFNRGDMAAVVSAFDSTIECHVSPALMNSGTWRGIDGYQKMIASWGEAWETIVMDVGDLETPDDHHVIAPIHQRAVGAVSGVPVELEVFFLFEVADGHAVRFHIYADRQAALDAVRK